MYKGGKKKMASDNDDEMHGTDEVINWGLFPELL